MKARIKERNEAEIELIPIKDIEVGQRRRTKLGSLSGLSKSISERGLLHPIVVREDNILVVGERRLRACERIGWKSIPARRYEDLSDEERHLLELDENLHRKDLDSYEAGKERLREIEAAQAEIEKEFCGETPQKPGRPRKGNREVARRVGVDESTVRDTRRHVSVADEFPALQAPDWKKSHVLRADECLKEIGKKHRKTFGGMISEPGIDRKTALDILENLVVMPATERTEVAKLYKSKKPEDQSLAKTRAARIPPSPPGYLIQLKTVGRLVQSVIKQTPNEFAVIHKGLKHIAEMLVITIAKMEDNYQQFKKKEMERWN